VAQVTLRINGYSYLVGCEDGQEAHVQSLAHDFDRQVQEVGGQVGQVGDLRLFLMAALVTADELADAKLRLAQGQAQLAQLQQIGRGAGFQKPNVDPDPHALLAIEAATSRIEALIERLG
jgi:cell division protein ZapA